MASLLLNTLIKYTYMFNRYRSLFGIYARAVLIFLNKSKPSRQKQIETEIPDKQED